MTLSIKKLLLLFTLFLVSDLVTSASSSSDDKIDMKPISIDVSDK